MPSDVRSGKRERAEAYATEAAEAARRGDHRKAAMLYQAAFIALEDDPRRERSEPGDDLPEETRETFEADEASEADRPGETK